MTAPGAGVLSRSMHEVTVSLTTGRRGFQGLLTLTSGAVNPSRSAALEIIRQSIGMRGDIAGAETDHHLVICLDRVADHGR